MSQHVQCQPDGEFWASHRWEDTVLIRDVLRERRPPVAVELGTERGGFAALLAGELAAWGGRVLSVDHRMPRDLAHALTAKYENLQLLEASILAVPDGVVAHWITRPGACLYCDNGSKHREVEMYAPFLSSGGLLGVHDYGTEVDPTWVEPFLAGLGYRTHRHEEFAALAHPVWYPVALTRFWIRE